MNESWYYDRGGAQTGPVSEEDLRAALAREEITRHTLVWKAGMAQWQPLEDVEELQPLLAAIPPPLPPPVMESPPPLPPPGTSPPPPPTGDAAGGHVGKTRPGSEPPRSPTEGKGPGRSERPGSSLGRVAGVLNILEILWRWLVERPIVATVLVLVLTGGIVCAFVCPTGDEPEEPPAAPGRVKIDANPWGEVKWIRGPDGVDVELPQARTTPFLTSLPAGKYQALVEYTHSNASGLCELEVQPDQLATCWLNLAPVNSASYFERLGW